MKKGLSLKSFTLGIVLLFIGVNIISTTSSFSIKNSKLIKEGIIKESLVVGTTIYVDDDNTEGPWDGTQENPYQFIQDGINNAESGDTIFVYSGFYYENVNVDKSLKIFGEDKINTIVDGGAKGSVFKVTADYVHIGEFTINNSRRGDEGGILSFSNHNKFYNNIITNHRNGIFLNSEFLNDDLEESNYNKIIGNIIKNNSDIGIHIGGDYNNYDDKFRFNYISNNIVTENRYGIIAGSLGCSFTTICNNDISNNEIDGIRIWGNHNKIIKNNISNHKIGIKIRLSFNTVIKKNNFYDNVVHAFFVDSLINKWVRNYWDDWIDRGPKIIRGTFDLDPYTPEELSIKNFDWFPAQKPYNINVISKSIRVR